MALFARYDRPAVEQRTVGLQDLVANLTTFHELANKRQARCWSPTLYIAGHTSRANAGVAAVCALVFDVDKVPPDPDRLAGVCWIGHTTWSHPPDAPRWRVVVLLAEPVPATSWGNVWRRARAARTLSIASAVAAYPRATPHWRSRGASSEQAALLEPSFARDCSH